jgi:hypothetical protein
MSEHDNKPDPIVKAPDQIVGRTWADLFFHGEPGPKLLAALSRVLDWPSEAYKWATEQRVGNLFQRIDQMLEEDNVENPKAIPERVAIEVMENVAREDREELFELWARLMVGSARGEEIDAYHIDLVRKLTPISARALIAIGDRYFDSERVFEMKDLFGETSVVEVVGTFARLTALGLIEEKPNAGSPLPWRLTAFGDQFLNILYPDRELPKRLSFPGA